MCSSKHPIMSLPGCTHLTVFDCSCEGICCRYICTLRFRDSEVETWMYKSIPYNYFTYCTHHRLYQEFGSHQSSFVSVYLRYVWRFHFSYIPQSNVKYSKYFHMRWFGWQMNFVLIFYSQSCKLYGLDTMFQCWCLFVVLVSL